MSQSIPAGYISLSNPQGLAQKRDLTFESCSGTGNSTRARILWKFKVKRFVRVLVLLVIKSGNTTLLISSSNYAKHHINVCSDGDLCSLFFSNFSETPCMKIGFDVRISFV